METEDKGRVLMHGKEKAMQQINKFFPQTFTIFVIAAMTALLGELKITVFDSHFRFGLGSAVFFFALLFYREVSYLIAGFVSGLFITFFRIVLDFFSLEQYHFYDSFFMHSPIIGYYFVFALFLNFGRAKEFLDSPFYLGVLGSFSDGLSNFVELLIRTIIHDEYLLTSTNMEYVFIVGILRSFFVVGLFNMIYTSQIKAVVNEQRSKYEQIQLISSGLYVESFYLKKLLNQIEEVTAKSFTLYQNLKNYPEVPPEVTSIALSVTQEVHEIKKDNQRVMAGLNKIIEQETVFVDMNLEDLINVMVRSNQKYASLFDKEIQITEQIEENMSIKNIYPFVVILNNILANSVEAIPKKGFILINAKVDKEKLIIQIIDNGIGILPGDEEVIFEPGYTTKFDEVGRPSTGIGLSHVKSMVEKLNGNVHLFSESNQTVCKIEFPITIL